jgi:hypothetical protein
VIEHTGFVWFFIWTSLIGIPVALLAVFVWYRVGISDEAPIQVGEAALVARFSQIEGYKCLSLTRALDVVKCQLALA